MSLFDARFYDFCVHATPDRQDAIEELAFVAKRYGYSGIAVINSTINLDTVHKQENFSMYQGVEISCKPSKIREEIRKHKSENNILIARGGDEEFNRAAVETEGLDILLQPSKINNVLAKTASDNSVILGFDIVSLIRKRGEARIRDLTLMRANLKHARKYRLGMILTCDARSHYDLRPPREMAALAGLFGMTPGEAVDAMSATPLDILRKKGQDYIQEGVELL